MSWIMKKLLLMLGCLLFLNNCAESLKGGDFTYVIDKSNPLKVTFNSVVPSSKSYGDISIIWDFGDGQQSEEPNPTHDYRKDGMYNVSLKLKSSKAFIESDVVSKEVPIVVEIVGYDFTYKVDPNNSLAYLFEAQGSIENGIIEYEWNFGDGKVITGNNVSHVFNELGKYQVELIATIADTGIKKSLTKEVEIALTISDLDFTYNADPNNPLNLQFTASGKPSRGELEYEWDFGFGATKKGQSVTYKYGSVGTFDVTLTGTIQGTNTTFTIVKKINTSIFIQDADFTFGSEEGNPLEVYFNGNGYTSGGEVDYEWDFGKGVIIASKNTSYRFTSFGDHLVTLKVYIYGTGVAQYITKKVTIAPPEIIGLDIIATPSSTNPLEIFFEAKGSTSFGEIEYEWDFGRGNTSKGKTALIKFENFGDYMVNLKVSVSGTLVSDDFSKKITIPAPVISGLDFTFSPGIKKPEEVFFEAKGSTSFGELEYAWDFGRGQFANGNTALHTFDSFSKFNVYLKATVKDTKVTQSVSKLLNLEIKDRINFTCNTADSVNNTELLTTCTPILPPNIGDLTYKWEFGDPKAAGISTNEISQHTYSSNGKYRVKLTVDGALLQNKLYLEQDIYVLAKPKIDIRKEEGKLEWVGGKQKRYKHIYIVNTWMPYDQNTVDVKVTYTGSRSGEFLNFTGEKTEVYGGWDGGHLIITVEYIIKGTGFTLSKTEEKGW